VQPEHATGQWLPQPSYRYTWDSPDKPTIFELGVLARRDPQGRAVLNFEPILSAAEPEMDWAADYTPSVAALALTIIVHLLERADAGRDLPLHWVRAMARQFAEIFLCTMPDDGGCIPIDVMDHWLRSVANR